MTDPSDPRAVPPCHRVRAGSAPPPIRFPDTPYTRTDAGRAAAHATREAHAAKPAPARGYPSVPRPRRSVSPGVVILAFLCFVCIVLPFTLFLVSPGG